MNLQREIGMRSSRGRRRSFYLFVSMMVVLLLASCSGGGEQDPIGYDACVEVECDEGLFCEAESGQCVCSEGSCGEGRVCGDDGFECVEMPHLRCERGTSYDEEADRCVCDEDVCAAGGLRACSDDGARCVVIEDGQGCEEGAVWAGTSAVFEEVSAQWGLTDPPVVGARISAVDFDGDGRPDLIVRRGGAEPHVFGESSRFWLLKNTGQGFEDVTKSSGILARRDGDESRGRLAEVVAFADINNNGHLDVVTLFSAEGDDDPTEGAEILWNKGDGTFELGPSSEPLHGAGVAVGRSGASFTDVDRDGFVDLWIGQSSGQDLLLMGDGTGKFEDRTEELGLATERYASVEMRNQARAHSATWSTAACDLDGDGTPNLLAGNYGRAPNHLWHGEYREGELRFFNHSIASGYSFDERQDWRDNESARCYCKYNREAEDCADVPVPAYIVCNSESDAFRWNHSTDRELYRLGGNSGTTVCGDVNNDGRLDLLTTEIVHWDVGSSSDPSELLINTGESPPRFERPGNQATGLTKPRSSVAWDDGDITGALFDFDNDGRLDVLIASTDYPGTRAHLYHQQPDGTFKAVPIELGIDLTSAHGVAVADFDGDGALDVVIGHNRSRCGSGDHCLDEAHVRLFRNVVGQKNNWIQLDLEGAEGTNRAAIGAQVTVVTEELLRVSEVGGGHGHYGMQDDLVQHFGLGEACEALVIIRWPDAELTEEVYRLPAGQRYRVRQGEWPTVVE